MSYTSNVDPSGASFWGETFPKDPFNGDTYQFQPPLQEPGPVVPQDLNQHQDQINYWQNAPFNGVLPDAWQNRPIINNTIKKRKKRIRTAFTTEQLQALENIFKEKKYVSAETRRDISSKLNIGDKSVKIWFQNRRMREKRESSDSSRFETDNSSDNNYSNESLSPSTISPTSYVRENVESSNCVGSDISEFLIPKYNVVPNNVQPQVQQANTVNYGTLPCYNNIYPPPYYPQSTGNQVNYMDNSYYHYNMQHNYVQENYLTPSNYAPYNSQNKSK